MIQEVSAAIGEYQQKWEAMVKDRANQDFFNRLKPIAVGWKTLDLADFDKRFAELRDHCDHIHIGLINNRWIATMHLKAETLNWGITVVKLMQRRAGSNDPVGLDNMDFYSDVSEFTGKEVLQQEPSLKWETESNGFANWISVWFDGTEAKIRTESVLEVCIKELRDIDKRILA
jgi:hypothetical protein